MCQLLFSSNFIPGPYGSVTPRVVGLGQCLLPALFSLLAAGDNNSIARGVVNSALIALPGWLPFLNNEAHAALILFVTSNCALSFCPQRDLDASTFVAFDPAASAAAVAVEQAMLEEAEEDEMATSPKRQCFNAAVESNDEEEEGFGTSGRDDVEVDIDDDDEGDQDSISPPGGHASPIFHAHGGMLQRETLQRRGR
ncbi:hypothetical protein RHMOL_Rhmol01G0155700 [Rhododendron molle]|uniref:Uncharacterized protein n=1 Tax=Rhododendron molle TaxID=49168 RepID=A0ACC0Q370_RHOML|nr:hypothetical protein RHMOL_Rhmol01G0155700 [Rhododendron molle]